MPEPASLPPIANAPLSVVLTAANAGPQLEEVLDGWYAYLTSLDRPFEILLVDDGSIDGTAERAEQLRPRLPHLRVLRHAEPRGLGAALHSGIDACQYPLVFTAPCDKQFYPPDLRQTVGTIDKVHLVVGYRVAGPLPLWLRMLDGCRRLAARIVLGAAPEPRDCWLGWQAWRRGRLARWAFGVRVQDAESPYRLYRREIFRRIPIQSHSSAALVEILAKANHLECVMAEIPVSSVPPSAPQTNLLDNNRAAELKRLFLSPDFGPPFPSEKPAAMLDYEI